jgi:Peptidase inhibitor family I36
VKTVIRIVLAGVLAVGIGTVGAGSAQAASCTKGYACLWVNSGFTGTSWGNSNNSGTFDVWTTGVNDAASSAWANGAACRYTTWYKHGSQTGDWFALRSQTHYPSYFNDSNLSNGAGYSGYTTQNFDNQLSSWKFSGC